MNPYYNVSGAPANRSAGASATIRAEFAAIAAGFESLNNLVTINANGVQVLGSGHIGVGMAPLTSTLYAGLFDTGAVTTAVQLTGYATSPSIVLRLASGSLAVPGATQINTNPLNIVGSTTADGTTFFNTVAFAGYAEATTTVGSHPTYAIISTTPAGSTTRVERLRVSSEGNIGQGTTPLALSVAGVSSIIFNNANTGTVLSNSTLRLKSANRNSNLQLSSVAAGGFSGLQFLESATDTLQAQFAYDYTLAQFAFYDGGSVRLTIPKASGSLIPAVTATAELGSASLEWLNLYTPQVQRASAGTLTINASNAAGIIALRTAGADKLTLTADGRMYGSALHNNAGAVTGTTNQYIASGTYTPTITNSTNVLSSTPRACMWIRVGNVVHVAGSVTVTTTAAGGATTSLRVSLPIASTISGRAEGSGMHAADSLGASNAAEVGYMIPFTNDMEMQWSSANNSNHNHTFHFTYLMA